jgi:hypothetical protein
VHRDEFQTIVCGLIDIQLLQLVLSQLKIRSAVVREDPWVIKCSWGDFVKVSQFCE